jgi:cation:H+ antiporter
MGVLKFPLNGRGNFGFMGEFLRVESFFSGLPLWLNSLAFLLGMVVILKGAEWFTDGAVGIADATGVPKIFIGATVVSIATTSPEVSVSFMAAYMGQPATSIGNAVGSTICNIGLILALAATIQAVRIPRATARFQGMAMAMAGAVLIFLSLDGVIGRWDGILLLAGTGVYLWIMVRQSGWNNGNSISRNKDCNWGEILRLFLLGFFLVIGGSVFVVQNAVILARAAGVSELIIGLTMVALGTSLPECITAISSSLRGHGEIAVGNVIGANVLNMTLVVGGSAAILPLGIEPQMFILDYPVMMVLVLLVFILTGFRGVVGRRSGLVFFSIYAYYLILLKIYFL